MTKIPNRQKDASPDANIGNMARGTLSMLVAEFLLLPSGLITAIFLARSLGPEGYGLFSVLALLVAWVKNNSTSAFVNVSVKLIGETDDWQPIKSVVTYLYLIIGVVTGLIFFCLAGPLANLLGEPETEKFLKIFVVDIILASISCGNRNILVGRGFFKEAAIVKSINIAFRLILIILFVELGFSLTGAIFGLIGATVAEFLISSWYAGPTIVPEGKMPIKRLFDIGFPLFISQLAINMIGLHFFVLKILGAGADEAGYFGAAFNLAIPPMLFSTALTTTLYSTVNRMVSNGRNEEAKRMVFMAIRTVFFLFPFAFMSAGLSGEIVNVVYGESFAEAGPVLSLLIFIPVIFLMIQISKIVLIVSGRQNFTLLLTLPVLIVALTGHFLFTGKYLGVGAAAVSLVAGGVGFFPAYYLMYRIWRVGIPLRTLLVSIFISIGAYYIAVVWRADGMLVFLKIFCISVTILIVLRLCGEFREDETVFIRQMFRRA